MASTQAPQILLTGASGFIGGTILAHLLNDPSPTLRSAKITCLVRGPERARTLSTAYGERVRPVVYKDLDDLEATTAAAAEHDIVIGTTPGFHAASAQALLKGLAQRKAATGRDVWMLHTSGTSNMADRPITGKWVDPQAPEGREFDDARDDIYAYERGREAQEAYAQRTVEMAVVDKGLELGVKTVVIMSPTIYGKGSGLFNSISMQVPSYIRCTLDNGHAVVVDGGKGVWDHVHVEDLAELYKLIVVDVLEKEGKNLPTGKKGILFSGNGRHTWAELAQLAADACYEKGKVKERSVKSVGLSEGAKLLASFMPMIDESIVELGLCSNSKTVSTLGRRLGWKPTRGEEAWKKGIHEDLEAVLEKN